LKPSQLKEEEEEKERKKWLVRGLEKVPKAPTK